MNQRQFSALDDYFDALLEEGPEPQPKVAVEAEPESRPVAAADPQEEARRRSLESLLARVAELKEEEAGIVLPEASVEAPAIEVEPGVPRKPSRWWCPSRRHPPRRRNRRCHPSRTRRPGATWTPSLAFRHCFLRWRA
ncbi:hypothetical protein MBH78_12460 [Oceanimonas sp. NS1]|nr:hypothetical protein [Oceanimonas sp. NS1]